MKKILFLAVLSLGFLTAHAQIIRSNNSLSRLTKSITNYLFVLQESLNANPVFVCWGSMNTSPINQSAMKTNIVNVN